MKNILKLIAIVLITLISVQESRTQTIDPDPKDGSTLCVTDTECSQIVDCSGSGSYCRTSENGTYPKAGMCEEEEIIADVG